MDQLIVIDLNHFLLTDESDELIAIKIGEKTHILRTDNYGRIL